MLHEDSHWWLLPAVLCIASSAVFAVLLLATIKVYQTSHRPKAIYMVFIYLLSLGLLSSIAGGVMYFWALTVADADMAEWDCVTTAFFFNFFLLAWAATTAHLFFRTFRLVRMRRSPSAYRVQAAQISLLAACAAHALLLSAYPAKAVRPFPDSRLCFAADYGEWYICKTVGPAILLFLSVAVTSLLCVYKATGRIVPAPTTPTVTTVTEEASPVPDVNCPTNPFTSMRSTLGIRNIPVSVGSIAHTGSVASDDGGAVSVHPSEVLKSLMTIDRFHTASAALNRTALSNVASLAFLSRPSDCCDSKPRHFSHPPAIVMPQLYPESVLQSLRFDVDIACTKALSRTQSQAPQSDLHMRLTRGVSGSPAEEEAAKKMKVVRQPGQLDMQTRHTVFFRTTLLIIVVLAWWVPIIAIAMRLAATSSTSTGLSIGLAISAHLMCASLCCTFAYLNLSIRKSVGMLLQLSKDARKAEQTPATPIISSSSEAGVRRRSSSQHLSPPVSGQHLRRRTASYMTNSVEAVGPSVHVAPANDSAVLPDARFHNFPNNILSRIVAVDSSASSTLLSVQTNMPIGETARYLNPVLEEEENPGVTTARSYGQGTVDFQQSPLRSTPAPVSVDVDPVAARSAFWEGGNDWLSACGETGQQQL